MAMTREKAEALVKQYGGIRKAAKGSGESERQICKGLHSCDNGPVHIHPGSEKPKRRTVSEAELLRSTDPETKVRADLVAVLKTIKPGEYMADFSMRLSECHCGDVGLWHDIREMEEFHTYQMMVGRGADPVLYWGHPSSIASMIERAKARQPRWVK